MTSSPTPRRLTLALVSLAWLGTGTASPAADPGTYRAAAAPSPIANPARGTEIEHDALGCVVSGQLPQIEARFAGAARVAGARVYFRPAGQTDWHYVDMAVRSAPGTAPEERYVFSGVIPSPLASLERLSYYIEASVEGSGPYRTREHTADVVTSPGDCRNGPVAAAARPVSSIQVHSVADGRPGVPAGFSTSGVAAPGTPTTTANVGSEGGGRGLSKKTLALTGLLVAGGGAAVAIAAGGDEGGRFAGTAAPLEATWRAYGCTYSVLYPEGRATMSIGQGEDLVTIEFPVGTQTPIGASPGTAIEACGGTVSIGRGFVSLPLTVSGDGITASGPTPSGNSFYDIQAIRDGDEITGTYVWRPNPERFLAESDPTSGSLALSRTQ